MLRSKSLLSNLKLKTLFFCLFSLIFTDLMLSEDAEARRRGYSRSRSRSSSYRSSRRRSSSSRSSRSSSRSRRSTRSRPRSKGLDIKGIFTSSKPRKRARGSQRSSNQVRRSSSRRTRRSRRYKSYGNWWQSTSTLKRSWRKNFRPRRRFRRSFFNRHRPIVDVWDPYFLASAATALFWYHHWHDPEIQEALYSDHILEDAELVALEAKVKAYEAEGIVRNPDYLPEGISPQDAYSTAYIDRERRRHESGGGGLILLVSIIVGLGLGFKFFRG